MTRRLARHRMLRLVVALTALSLIVGACSKNKDDSEEVRDIVDATTPNPFRFIYEVEQAGEKFRVQGIVEDDLRYKMQLSIDGRPALEQVVVDDAIAVRFLAPGLVDRFIDERVAEVADTETDVEGADVLAALRAQRWVVDPVGAPSLLLTAREASASGLESDVSDDPLFDARTVLSYVRGIPQPFIRYNPESLEPTYRADEDPFQAPETDSGVTRFDTFVLDLPSPDDAGGGTGAVFPGYQNFRRMAVYSKDGAIIAVREATRPTERQIDDFLEYADDLVKETAPPEVYADFQTTVETTPPDKLADFLLTGINAFRDSSGQAPVRFRTMAFELQDLGDPDIEVVLPTTEVVTASLAILDNMGRKPFVDDAGGESQTGFGSGGIDFSSDVAAEQGVEIVGQDTDSVGAAIGGDTPGTSDPATSDPATSGPAPDAGAGGG